MLGSRPISNPYSFWKKCPCQEKGFSVRTLTLCSK
uniref:Uncharacterized protein n=1 Tax=Anguilla anguilla TaxID=7936 RepID=A0A0E9SKK1_ANGAN